MSQVPKRKPAPLAARHALSLREQLFAAAYLANHGNATQAAIEAGYSARTAYAKGPELLKRPRVVQAIERAKARILTRYQVSAERVVEEMAVIAFSDVCHYCLTDDGLVTLAPGAPESAMRAVKRIKRKLRTIPQKDGTAITEIDTEFEIWSKDAELRALGDYLGLFKTDGPGAQGPREVHVRFVREGRRAAA